MDKNNAVNFLEQSFLSDLVKNDDVTDISFNGESIYYVSNTLGRKKSNIQVNETAVKDFIRQIANLCEKQFSYLSPILDVTFGKYRLNALHQSVSRANNSETITFSLRIASIKPRINDESTFFNKKLVSLFNVLIKSKTSLLIGGSTGSGKTEFQKYLLRKISSNSRVIVIDNVSELEFVRDNKNADITFWNADERNEYTTISSLIRNALRCNPDWLIVAESRGGEMEDVLNSALTGVPIISTIHSFDVFSMPSRAVSMVMMNDKRNKKNEILKDLNYHIRFYVFLEKIIDLKGFVHRKIKAIGEILPDGKMHLIYSHENNCEFYEYISKTNAKMLDFDENDGIFIKTFIGEN